MKTFKPIFLIFLIANLALYTVAQQSPSDPVWGLFASGVGEPLKRGMDPCWITYTVGLMSDPKIQINVSNGLMGTLMANVNWYDATAGQRRFGR